MCSSQRVLSLNEGLVIVPIPGSGQGQGQGRVDPMPHQADSHRLKVRYLDLENFLDVYGDPSYDLHISKHAHLGLEERMS